MVTPRLPVCLFPFVMVVVAMASCSSAPPKSDTVTGVKDQAAVAATAGQKYYSQGRYDLALQFFQQALEASASVDNLEGVIKSRIAIGQVYLATGQEQAAEDMLGRAREQARAGSPSLFVDSSIGLAEISLRKNDPHRCLATLEEALDASRGKLTPVQIGVLYHDMGAAWKSAGDMSKALDWLSRSLQSNLTNKLWDAAAADYYMIASVQSKEGDFAKATSSAEQALALDKKVENTPGIAKDLYALALISSKSGDAAEAYDYYQRAYNAFSILANKDEMRKCLTGLISVAESLGRAEEAQGYRQALERTDGQ